MIKVSRKIMLYLPNRKSYLLEIDNNLKKYKIKNGCLYEKRKFIVYKKIDKIMAFETF